MKSISHIQELFTNQKAYVAYLMAGDGGIKRTLDAALALIEGGVNMLEIGIPFSDPIADGPVIQRAAARSLAAGTSLQDILWLIMEIRRSSRIPLILFSYLNPILSGFQSDFLAQAKNAGIDGLLLVDCPLEESDFIREHCRQLDLAFIAVITPATSLARINKIARHAQGFLYYACRAGTTGMRDALPDDFQPKIRAIKSQIHLPIVVGFGISNSKMAKLALDEADGVVVGSLFVKALEEDTHSSFLSALAKDIFQNK